jgi:translation initiation factor 2 alpha subunit (eIF-2alpha)
MKYTDIKEVKYTIKKAKGLIKSLNINSANYPLYNLLLQATRKQTDISKLNLSIVQRLLNEIEEHKAYFEQQPPTANLIFKQ